VVTPGAAGAPGWLTASCAEARDMKGTEIARLAANIAKQNPVPGRFVLVISVLVCNRFTPAWGRLSRVFLLFFLQGDFSCQPLGKMPKSSEASRRLQQALCNDFARGNLLRGA